MKRGFQAADDEGLPGGSRLWRALVRQLSPGRRRDLPPVWRESRLAAEFLELVRDPIFRGIGLPQGRGRPVFLIPGYLAGDASLAPMARALRAAGFRPETAGFRLNVGCASAIFAPVEARLVAHVAAHGGQKAFVIGQSRGGGLGRWLALRRPDLVSGIVTLGTPLCDPLAVHPLVLANVGVVSTLGTLGMPGLFTTQCLRLDRCCEAVWREGVAPLADEVSFLSIYSRSDGIVDWRTCLDPAARHLEVASSHCGMAFNVGVLRAIGAELGP